MAKVSMIEHANEEKIHLLLKSQAIDLKSKKLLRKYLKQKDGDNAFRVTYDFSTYALEGYGRLFVHKGCGLQSFKKDVRNFVAGEYYHDIDMVNAQPTLLLNLFKAMKVDCPNLQVYVDKREQVLAKFGLDKHWVIKYLNTSSPGYAAPKFFEEIHDQIYGTLVLILQKHASYSKLWTHIKRSRHKDYKDNREGSFVSYIVHTMENLVLEKLMEFLHSKGCRVEVMIFDGCLILRIHSLTDRLLREAEAAVADQLRLQVRFAEKDMTVSKEFMEAVASSSEDNGDENDDAGSEEEEEEEDAILAEAKRSPSHLSMARALASVSDGAFVFDDAQFWHFDSRWKPAVSEVVRGFMQKYLNPIWKAEIKHLIGKGKKADAKVKHRLKQAKNGQKMLENNSQIKSIVQTFQSEVHDGGFVSRLDTDPMKVGCENGYIDLKDGLLRPYAQDVLITKSVGYNYFTDENEKDPTLRAQWLDYVEKVWPIKEERDVAQTYFGYCLRGDHPEKVFAIFKDKTDGYNAKSKTAQALIAALGGYAKDGLDAHLYANSGSSNPNGHNASLFAYASTRLAIFEELDERKSLDTKKAKRDHSGNGKVSGRRPHATQDEIINLFCKWILIFNDRCQPKFDTSDLAFMKRMLVIIFRTKFLSPEEYATSTYEYKQLADPHVGDRFESWRPYILEWLLEGYRMYEKNGFNNVPSSCKEWKQEVSAAVNNIQDWIEENLEECEGSYVELKAIKSRAGKFQFKDKKHWIDELSVHLGQIIRDTTVGEKRCRDIWKGWRFQVR